MKESDFIKFYKKRNNNKSHKEAKEKIELFWNTIFEALNIDEKVVLKNWGSFQKKSVKSREILVPTLKKVIHTKSKDIIKFKAGLGLLEEINRGSDHNE